MRAPSAPPARARAQHIHVLLLDFMTSVHAAPCTPLSHDSGGATALPIQLAWHRLPASARASRIWTRRLGIVDREHSAWGSYLRAVYGEGLRLPFDLRRLRWFWWWAPGAANLTRIEVPVWRQGLPGEAWVPGLRMERHLATAGFFVQHADATHADSKVDSGADRHLEVMRVSHPVGESTQSAFGPEAAGPDQTWYWHAPGSGIWLSLGRSLAVQNRSELLGRLVAHFRSDALPLAIKHVRVTPERGLRLCDGCDASTKETWRDFDVLWWASPAEPNFEGPRVCELVRRAGFDTVQLTRAFDGQRHEMIDCRRATGTPPVIDPTATAAACPPIGSRIHLRSGGGDAPCRCDPTRSFLNCGDCIEALRVWRTARSEAQAAAVEVRAPRSGKR